MTWATVAVLAAAISQAPPQPAGEYITPRMAAATVAFDFAKQADRLPPDKLKSLRYVYTYKADPDCWRWVSFALNSSLGGLRSTIVSRPVQISPHVVRIYGDRYTSDPEKVGEVLALYERLAIFHPFCHETKEIRKGDAVRHEVTLAPHVADVLEPVVQATGSMAVLIEVRHFLSRSLWTLQGGLYYDWLGIPQTWRGDVSPREQLFAQLGVDFDDLENQQRVALISEVTKNRRRIDWALGENHSPAYGLPINIITRDVDLENRDPRADVFRTLARQRRDAEEFFFKLKNGGFGGALYNARGDTQRAAPGTVVGDRTVPNGHPPVLAPFWSCFRCHGQATDGEAPARFMQPARNDAIILLSQITGKNPAEINLLEDLAAIDESTIPEGVETIVSLYAAGDFERLIRRIRVDYADWTDTVTDGKTIAETSRAMCDLFAEYVYETKTPTQALAELGRKVEDADAAQQLATLIGTIPPDFFGSQEDRYIALLRACRWTEDEGWDFAVHPFQYYAVYSALATRAEMVNADRPPPMGDP